MNLSRPSKSFRRNRKKTLIINLEKMTENLFKKIKKEAEKFFHNAKGSHDLEHTKRVLNLCLHIGKKESANLNILKIAAILHDIGRFEEDKSKGKICHAEKGAFLSRKILEKYNFDKNNIDKIVHCVETHRFRDNKIPETKEAKILFDADKLDSIGATGIGKAFLFSGEIGAKLHNDKNTDISKTKPYTEEDTAYREYVVKLSKIKDRLFTKEGKRIAKERHGFMEEFFDRLDREVNGDI